MRPQLAGWTDLHLRDRVLVGRDPRGREWSIGEVTPRGASVRWIEIELLGSSGSRIDVDSVLEQDRVEPVLRRMAEAAGAEWRAA